jgi:hypothetical protein
VNILMVTINVGSGPHGIVNNSFYLVGEDTYQLIVRNTKV